MRIHTRGAARLYAPLALVPLLVQPAFAQNLPDLDDLTQVGNLPSGTAKSEATKATSKAATTDKDDEPTSKATSRATATSSAKDDDDDDDKSTSSGGLTVPTTAITGAPSLSTTSQSVFRLTGLPTIAGAGIPSMIVPNTAGAPFMQKSTLPEGTVFIVVAAILGFLGFCILIWRASIAWALKKSVRRAAMAQALPDSKALLAPGGAPNASGAGSRIYPHGGGTTVSSSLSLEKLSATGKGASVKGDPRRKSGIVPSSQAPSTSLFFSPTAGAGIHTSTSPVGGLSPNPNRSSGYLPAGYYPSSSGITAGGASSTTLGGMPGAPGASMLNMGSSGQQYQRSRSLGTDEPASPQLSPTRGYDRGYDRSSVVGTVNGGGVPMTTSPGPASGALYSQPSTSTLNLGAPPNPNQRVPSAYLEDLFNRQDGRDGRDRF